MRIVVTGAHFSPALAVIEQLKDHSNLLFVGRKYAFEGETTLSYEYLTCKKLGIPFETIRTGRLQRVITRYTLSSLVKFPFGVLDALSLLKKANPDVILAFGGYVALPVALVGFFLGIPVIIHEQTLAAGLTSRIIALFAKKVCISYVSSKKYFPGDKVVLTGNPIRQEVFQVKKKIAVPSNLKIIYVTGGSTGAHFINKVFSKIIKRLLSSYVVIHQTGDSARFGDYSKLKGIRSSLPKALQARYILRKFIFPDEIGWVMKNSALVVSRAGANTVSELLANPRPSLLIPLPHGQGGEQLENARMVKEVGIGDYIEQEGVDAQIIFLKIRSMIENQALYLQNKKNAKKYVVPNAVQRIVDVVQSCHEQKTKKNN